MDTDRQGRHDVMSESKDSTTPRTTEQRPANKLAGASPVLNIVLVVLAIVGVIALVGIAGMGAMHVAMMDGFGSCGTAMDNVRHQ